MGPAAATSAVGTPDDDRLDAAALEAGRLLFARECRFIFGTDSIGALPPIGPVEIAFAGRSNVGKSSLLNALTGRTSLARTSNTPGRTRQLNYFDLDGQCVLVDMPGYGYAEAPKHEIRRWQELIGFYLTGRPTLRRVIVLVDSRHGLKPNDRRTMDALDEAAVSYQVVLTKCDKQRPEELAKLLARTASELAKRPAAHPEILTTSAASGAGMPELRARLAQLVKTTAEAHP
ncbi:MAG: YihA family ribosome biogenesis GTP-binding protein [Proteobacteria bacterium]|nr:YihA family ribosome biogenesis GTP-binding protein [Pseudomonadota bacterium]MBI3499681.1 YihA family ribosome biogenesis GTP-binding protein [Pseudomonadota bacterium]